MGGDSILPSYHAVNGGGRNVVVAMRGEWLGFERGAGRGKQRDGTLYLEAICVDGWD